MPQQSSFEFMGLPLKKSLLSFIKEVFSIFRVNEFIVHPTWLAPLLQSDAEIFERCVIDIESLSIRSKYSDVLRRQIQNLPKLCFLFADFFCRTTILDSTRTLAAHDSTRPRDAPARPKADQWQCRKPSRVQPR